jgi:glutamate formiminotransferase
MSFLVECVPNFSEGHDTEVVTALAGAISGTEGAVLLDRSMDPDHNRCVLTFAGEPAAVVEAAVRSIRVARDRINLVRHAGVHPRLGAADVIPFIPLRGMTLADCAALAEQAAHRVWSELGVPVYLYEAAARRPERKRLENVRRGGFERLRDLAPGDPAHQPDIGGPGLHPSAGAAIIGARQFLIAWNVTLTSADLGAAKAIARSVRESSGGLRHVKAMGLMLESRGVAQVSMNLTDYASTPIGEVYRLLAREAQVQGVTIDHAELIGLIPEAAWQDAITAKIPFRDFGPEKVVERRVEEMLQLQ